jgi:hypothetical protein
MIENIETITLVDKNKWFYEISRGGGSEERRDNVFALCSENFLNLIQRSGQICSN